MAPIGSQAIALDRLDEEVDGGDRYVDLQIDLRVLGTEDLILSVGGRWDRKARCYAGPAATSAVLHVHGGQLEAARWFARWLRDYLARGDRASYVPDPVVATRFALMLAGGRRGGKSYLACVLVALLLVAAHGSIGWLVASKLEKAAELQAYIDEILPARWVRWNERRQRWRLLNGSVVYLKSAHDPTTLKQGRADIVLINEAQEQSEVVYALLRPAVADTGGLVILAANPPIDPIGAWVECMHEDLSGEKHERPAVLFDLDPKLNPFPVPEALSTLASEVDDVTYRREVLGEWGLSTGDRAWWAFSGARLGNVQPVGLDPRDRATPLEDVTEVFTRRIFNRPFLYVVGCDFQRTPAQVATIRRLFADPDDPTGAPLDWTVAELLLEQADENELIDALEQFDGIDLNPENTAVVADASGDWQDADRTKGRSSFDMFRRRGWRWIYQPDAHAKRNPDILDSMTLGNGRLKAADGRRRSYIDPRCVNLIRAMKRWRTRGGRPERRSHHAHISDAWRYPLHRLYPRRFKPKAVVGYERVELDRSPRRTAFDAL